MDLKDAYKKLKDRQTKNRVKFKWQDSVLVIIDSFGLPSSMQTSKKKTPLNVRSILMRHAKEDLSTFERRFAIVKEYGLTGESAFLYYLGIVENENK